MTELRKKKLASITVSLYQGSRFNRFHHLLVGSASDPLRKWLCRSISGSLGRSLNRSLSEKIEACLGVSP
jgi:hypothetical protein